MSVVLTYAILHQIAPQCRIAASLVDPLNKYLPEYGITSLLRMDHFLGQAAEESAGFATLTEYASGREYEWRRDLGNTQAGDGVRYKGRGIFQLTGRANYARMSLILGIDLINNPELAATADIAVRVACEYWKTHGLSALADNDDLEGITRRINGGLNGLADRTLYTNRADMALSTLFPKDEEGRIADNKGLDTPAPVVVAAKPAEAPVVVPEVKVVPKPVTVATVTDSPTFFQKLGNLFS